MKFSVNPAPFAKAIQIVSKGIASNSTLPILSGIKITAQAGTLEFQATDLTISIKHNITALVDEEGSTIVSGKLIQNIVKNLPDETVHVHLDNHLLILSCGRSLYKLNTLPAEDFPEFPEFEISSSVELPCSLVSQMVDKVYKATSKDITRITLTGILMQVADNTVRMIATDSYRLAVCDSSTSLDGNQEFTSIVPGTVFHEVLTLADHQQNIFIGATDSQIIFMFGDTTYISRKIEGNFPNYKQLLPDTFTSKITFNVADLSVALKRIAVIASSNPAIRLDLYPEEQVMSISASSNEQGEAQEIIPVEIEGNAFSINLNYRYVLDCIDAVSEQKSIELELQSPMLPGIFKSYSTINYLYLLMPVRA